MHALLRLDHPLPRSDGPTSLDLSGAGRSPAIDDSVHVEGWTVVGLEARGLTTRPLAGPASERFVAEDATRWAEWIRLAGITPQ